MANFKGFKQVSLAEYNLVSADEKKGYLWLVRELSGDTVLSSAIYFGTRKYAELNNDDERAANLVASLGSMVSADGEWLGFLPLEEHEILGEATDATDALSKIEAFVLEMKSQQGGAESAITELESAVEELSNTVETLEGKVAEAESAITTLAEEVEGKADEHEVIELSEKIGEIEEKVAEAESAITTLAEEVEKKANADEVYTKEEVYNKEEVDGMIAGTFKFKGNAEEISEDKKSIKVDNVWIVASEDNVGFVYQIGEKEYASNGVEWVELGFNIDLSEYAKKAEVEAVNSALTEEIAAREAVEEVVNELDSALTEEIAAREALGEEVGKLGEVATITAETFDDIVVADMAQGQIVYVQNDEQVESGRTAGAYIKVGDTLKKLDTSSGQGETPLDRIDALETKMGTTPIPGGQTVTESIALLLTVTGGDVEE